MNFVEQFLIVLLGVCVGGLLALPEMARYIVEHQHE
jgi:hypothetical protein